MIFFLSIMGSYLKFFLVELVGIFVFPKAILLGTEFGLLCKLQQSSCGF